MDAAFNFKAKSVVCFHLELKPITVGHLFLFDEEEINLFDLADSPVSDLLAACLILAQDWHMSRKLMRSIWLPMVVRFWRWRTKRLKVGEETTRFQEFIDEHFQLPQIKRDLLNNRVEASQIPLRWRLLAVLMSDFKMSYREALSFPVRDAHCLCVALDERLGRVKLMSEREKSFIAWAREQDTMKGLN